ncbi:MAG: hypothetical protein IKR33_05985 [Bacteroidales bacterium]|nr:hypothetical protein [Bacteroidales bacterium]
MATYKKGIDGPVMGKVGQHVGSKWKSIYYLRSLAAAVRNPRTPAQRRVRARFAQLMKMSHSFGAAIGKGFYKSPLMQRMTPTNIFISRNLDQVTATGPDSVEVNYGMLTVAEGRLAGVAFGAVDYGETQHLTISVAMDGSTGGDGADADDNVYLFAYCPDLELGVLSAPVKRSATAVTLSLSNNWDGQTVHLYGFAEASASNTRYPIYTCSLSAYCGSGEVQ